MDILVICVLIKIMLWGLKNRPIKRNKSIFYDDYLMHKIDEKGNIKIPQNYYEKKNVKCVKNCFALG
ncbi:hypothetical protein M33023_06580 [Candidatus Phytoplasma asteris]|uniref:SpoVT-AbrB domain-containing protein n=2 Tax=Candidatus Phytoplasma asteris TaxID=85620 RepID=A0ABZ2YFU7_9MOLU